MRTPAKACVIAALAGLAACSTPGVVGGADALSGKDLQAAVSLYGPWETDLILNGVRTYIWRRHYTDRASGQEFYCEMRAEMGFRNIISRTQMQGYPVACELFSVRYETTSRRQVDSARQQQRTDKP